MNLRVKYTAFSESDMRCCSHQNALLLSRCCCEPFLEKSILMRYGNKGYRIQPQTIEEKDHNDRHNHFDVWVKDNNGNNMFLDLKIPEEGKDISISKEAMKTFIVSDNYRIVIPMRHLKKGMDFKQGGDKFISRKVSTLRKMNLINRSQGFTESYYIKYSDFFIPSGETDEMQEYYIKWYKNPYYTHHSVCGEFMYRALELYYSIYETIEYHEFAEKYNNLFDDYYNTKIFYDDTRRYFLSTFSKIL